MRRRACGVAIAAALMGLGWTIGRAQAPQPDFELIVNAPAGETTVECRRGCEIAWVERGVNPASKPMQTFTFSCGGASPARCSSSRIGGWITR
jgi:hypothetical protein